MLDVRLGTSLNPNQKFAASPRFVESAWVKSPDDYRQLFQRAQNDPAAFWSEVAENFVWFRKWDRVCAYNYNRSAGPISIEWFGGAKTNITVNCLDRHLADGRRNKVALLWEGNTPGERRALTYGELHREVCRFANVLKSRGVEKGDRVSLYMPMVPETAIAMLACARIGAIHSVVFGGFSAESLADRILDADCKVLITADGAMRGNKSIPIKAVADAAMQRCTEAGHPVSFAVVLKRTGETVPMMPGRDVYWHDAVEHAARTCEPEMMDAEDPLFILYTSGSTGKPKGVLHTTAGYMVYTAFTHKLVFDHHDDDVYWCTADLGWITGHSYILYGPLANGATSVMFEGTPVWPDPGRFWSVCEQLGVNVFYTAPTALRTLMREGDGWVKAHDLDAIRLLGTVGEPINPEVWRWYHAVVGRGRAPIVDTWWQTETGGILIAPLPGAVAQKPGSATLPLPGVHPVLLNERGEEVEGTAEGVLALKRPWPGQMRTVYGDHKRFEDTYFSSYDGYYFTGDGCRRDDDGYWWITGRVDDVLNVSAHRIGTAEVEGALVSHPAVAEAAVVGFPHDIKGQGIFAYVTLKAHVEKTPDLRAQLVEQVRKVVGAVATPDVILWADALPKTRSGKIMRRILRKIASLELDNLGDTSTLADPAVVDQLVIERRALVG